MNNLNLELARKDIDEALEAVEAMEETLSSNALSKDTIKEKFELLAKKVDQLEKILMEEGILND